MLVHVQLKLVYRLYMYILLYNAQARFNLILWLGRTSTKRPQTRTYRHVRLGAMYNGLNPISIADINGMNMWAACIHTIP